VLPGLYRTFVGNDIVDLDDPRIKQAGNHDRFLERAFTPREREWVSAQPHRSRALWSLWAGKEAGFKAVSKALGHPPVFVHRRFEISTGLPGAPDRLHERLCAGVVPRH